MSLPLVIDSDNALGSLFGDVDDGFAISALLKSKVPVSALSSTFGNTSEARAFLNNQRLAQLCDFAGPLLRARDFSTALASPVRVLALGPLSNIARALPCPLVTEVLFVGTNHFRPLPAWRFFDFNLSRDLPAAREVFASGLNLTVIPCDVARRLRMGTAELQTLPGPLGELLRKHSRRWLLRARCIKAQSTVPVWDLVPAMYALQPELFISQQTRMTLSRSGIARYGNKEARPIKVVVDFDPKKVWNAYLDIMR